MRVIAGSAGGTRLYGVKGRNLRPMLDRVKESLFELIGDRLEGAEVLDLFAGVGNLGIEALSRGASHADFIEQHRPTTEAIMANLQRTHLSDKADVYARRLPRGLNAARGPYSLIFTDPPFRIDNRLMEGLFRLIRNRGLLETGGVLVYRYSPHSYFEPSGEEWSLSDRRDYGDSIVSFYELSEKAEGARRT